MGKVEGEDGGGRDLEPRGRILHQGMGPRPRRERRWIWPIFATVRTSWYDVAAGMKKGYARLRAELCGDYGIFG
jgi:hypothetical protein